MIDATHESTSIARPEQIPFDDETKLINPSISETENWKPCRTILLGGRLGGYIGKVARAIGCDEPTFSTLGFQ